MRKQLRQAVRFIWFKIGVALLVLALMEGVGDTYLVLRDRARTAVFRLELEQGYESDDGAPPSWVREYIREMNGGARETGWHPYVYWHRKPHHGKYLNVDEAGVRRTWNSTPSPAPGQLKVFMFGGSTLWGVGARDDFTIPSHVAKKLNAQLDSGVWVTNFAEEGYVSTQGVIALMLELRKGNVPDVVVFFDGVNDTFSAFQNGVAGISENENHRVAEFNSLARFNWRQTIETLALYRLTAGLLRYRGGSPSAMFAPSDGRSIDALAPAVVEVYLQNVRIVDALAQRFGFRAIFFWQPTVFTKKHLSQRERRWYGQPVAAFAGFGSGTSFHGVNGALRERIRTSRIDNVHDLSGVFDEGSGTIFIDEWHITEAANEKIAEHIVRTFLREVRGRSKGEGIKGGMALRR